MLAAQAAKQPTLVVFEDVHWMDAGSKAVLDRLVSRLSDLTLVIVITYRPEFEHD